MANPGPQGEQGPPGPPGPPGPAAAPNLISTKYDLPYYWGNRKTVIDKEKWKTMLGASEWISQIERMREAGNWDPQMTAARASLAFQGEALSWYSGIEQQDPEACRSWETLKPLVVGRFLRALTASEVTQNEKELRQGFFDRAGEPKEDVNHFMDRVISAAANMCPRPEQFTAAETGVGNITELAQNTLARKERERTIRAKFLGGLDAHIARELNTGLLNNDIQTIPLEQLRTKAVAVEVALGKDVVHPSTRTNPPIPQVASVALTGDDRTDRLEAKVDAMVEAMRVGGFKSNNAGGANNNYSGQGRGAGQNRGGGGGGGRGRGRGRGGGFANVTCYKCNKKGHIRRECPNRFDGQGRGGAGTNVEMHSAPQGDGHLDYSWMLSGN